MHRFIRWTQAVASSQYTLNQKLLLHQLRLAMHSIRFERFQSIWISIYLLAKSFETRFSTVGFFIRYAIDKVNKYSVYKKTLHYYYCLSHWSKRLTQFVIFYLFIYLIRRGVYIQKSYHTPSKTKIILSFTVVKRPSFWDSRRQFRHFQRNKKKSEWNIQFFHTVYTQTLCNRTVFQYCLQWMFRVFRLNWIGSIISLSLFLSFFLLSSFCTRFQCVFCRNGFEVNWFLGDFFNGVFTLKTLCSKTRLKCVVELNTSEILFI